MRLLPLLMVLGVGLHASLRDWSCLPRMRRQPHLRPYERPMPRNPEESVPQGGRAEIPSVEQAARLRNPVAVGRDALARGKVYYGYYCQACHGPDGRGHVPVGESYHPAPTDLTEAKVQSKADGELYRAMLVGTGHEPVIAYVVPAERRWLIVAHLRTLAAPGRPGAAGAARRTREL